MDHMVCHKINKNYWRNILECKYDTWNTSGDHIKALIPIFNKVANFNTKCITFAHSGAHYQPKAPTIGSHGAGS